MAVNRSHQSKSGSWLADNYDELSTIAAQHGDECYVADSDRWYKYVGPTGIWQELTASTNATIGEFYETDDGSIITPVYTGGFAAVPES